jgi:hypothetical protein
MKSELIQPKPAIAKHMFPILARLKRHPSLIVMFMDFQVGTVMREGNGFPLGMHHDKWTSLDEEETWEILPTGSQVILTQ